MIEIRKTEGREDCNLPNEPFTLWGRMVPSLKDGTWQYAIQEFENGEEMCFPDCPYDPKDGGIYLGAYEDGACVGVAVLRRGWFRYLYLEDLKVKRSQRGKGIGTDLISAAMKEAAREGLLGVYTVAQDNNLSACLFYLKNRFEIGGFDNRAYRGTSQEHKADIYFYRDLDE
jgi:GNAT superfamily N-acetyltransferase